MVSIIIYNSNPKYVDRTISDLLDKTPSSLIDEIIICDDSGSAVTPRKDGDTVKIIQSNQIGRACAWNSASEQAISDQLVFLGGPTKFDSDWLSPLLDEIKGEHVLASPVVHTLNLDRWASEDSRWERFGWRWDLELYNRMAFKLKETPTISSYCFAVDKEWFNSLGKFDFEMQSGYGEDIELSLRNWLFGGKCVVVDESSVSVALRLDSGPKTVQNLVRIVEAWMPEYSTFFYQARGLDRTTVNCGKISNLISLQKYQKRTIEWFLNFLQPELFGVYKLKGTAAGKSIAVVGPSVSIDMINPALINRHDIIIGVDYTGLQFNCDFVVTDTAHVVVELRKNYIDEKFVLPISLENRSAGTFDATSSIAPGAIQFELGEQGSVQDTITLDPPFCNFDNPILSAVHFALYLNPEYITLFGCDNKIIAGKSHSANIEYYNGGALWPDSEATRKKFAFYEFGLDRLGQLATNNGIPLFRMSHA